LVTWYCTVSLKLTGSKKAVMDPEAGMMVNGGFDA